MRKLLSVAVAGIAVGAMGGSLDHRWVWLTDSLVATDCVERVSKVVRDAKANGMNGVMFGCGIEFYKNWPKVRRDRLERIKAVFEETGMEMISTMWSLGYSSMQNYNVNCVEGVPVEGIPLVAQGTNAVLDEAALVVKKLDAKSGFQRSGGYCRLIKKLDIKPHRRYRYSFEYRTKGLAGDKPFKVIARDACNPMYFESEALELKFSPTQDWTPCTLAFNSLDSNAFYMYIGFMSGWKEGDFEVRNLTLAETAPGNVIKRPGTPTALRNAATGEVYEPGRDYVVPKLKYPVSRQDLPPVRLALPPGSRVKAGDRLVFDCYAPAVVYGRQVSTCLSEPQLYENLEDSARRTEAVLHPKRWMLSMDEFRNGGTCAACRARGLTMAQIYADAVTKAFNIIRKVHPGAEVYIWSDMLDPNHNAVKSYYNCRGSFEDGWKWVPKELVICCWYNKKSHLSMPFFASKGFRTLAAAYYDEKPPFEYSRKWRDVVLSTEGATGIMYTTWRNAYADLPEFSRMLDLSGAK
ncbi:MAG: hypothetical protein K6F50_02860 [Kiritimatiellae bacterium]|nr:hypothetical protein [Kiritimatiellia bacterium]